MFVKLYTFFKALLHLIGYYTFMYIVLKHDLCFNYIKIIMNR